MAVIPMTVRTARPMRLRPEDRIEREPLARRIGLTGFLAGTAIVAGCVTGLFLYDANRPFATGAAMAPVVPLAITVEPVSAGDPYAR